MKKVFIIIALIVGTLLGLQIRSFKKVESLVARSGQESFFSELRIFQLAGRELRDHIKKSEQTLAEIRTKIAGQAVEEELQRLRLLSGEEAVTGEGVEITIGEPIKAFWISDLVARLSAAGAEAIAVNDIRLTSQTAGFREIYSGSKISGLLMRRIFLQAPLTISVIGPSQELKLAIAQTGGITDRIKKQYPKIVLAVMLKETVVIPELSQ